MLVRHGFMFMLLACTGCFHTSLMAQPEREADIIGTAYDPDSDQILYLEHHYCDQAKLACSVFFLRPTGDLIASKTLDYRTSKQAPTLWFYDYRFGNELNLVPQDPAWIVDSGFDNFLRSQWPAITNGDNISFSMHLLGRDKPLDMIAKPTDAALCPDSRYCVDVALDSWLLGRLLSPIQLDYDRGTRNLLRFRGLSNLPSDAGKKQWVDIRYLYQSLNE